MENNQSYIKELEENINKVLSSNISYGLRSALSKVNKEISIFINCSIKNEKKEFKNKSKDKIQIGGGTRYLDDYFNIDINEPADLIHDVREGIPFDDNVSNKIYCEHFLEHLDYPRSAYKFIEECYRISKMGGQLIIGVPNAEQVIRAYVANDIDYYENTSKRWIKKKQCAISSYVDLVNYHFRDLADSDIYTPHLWNYDYMKLKGILEECGFTNVSKWDLDYDLVNPKRIDRTIFVVGTK